MRYKSEGYSPQPGKPLNLSNPPKGGSGVPFKIKAPIKVIINGHSIIIEDKAIINGVAVTLK